MITPTSAARTAIVVVDEPIETDRRVRTMIGDIKARGYECAVVDARNALTATIPVMAIAALRTWLSGVHILAEFAFRYRRFRKLWRDEKIDRYNYPPLRHYWHEVGMMFAAIYRGHVYRQQMASAPDLVVANDLLAGAFARALLGALAQSRLYYDAHEFSPFRNRANNSVARIAVDLAVEAWVATNAWRMGCVSQAICRASQEIYAPVKVDYVPNAYYAESRQPNGVIDPEKPLHLVYFGAPSLGRGLQILGEMAASSRALKVSLFVPEFLPFHSSLEWLKELDNVHIHLGFDYEVRLLDILNSESTVLSWCVIEDLCLSYRMAEPSKFHQSRMFGIPVVCAAGQQLAAIVQVDGNGVVLSQAELALPGKLARRLREALREGAERIGPATRQAWANSVRFPGWNWPSPSDK